MQVNKTAGLLVTAQYLSAVLLQLQREMQTWRLPFRPDPSYQSKHLTPSASKSVFMLAKDNLRIENVNYSNYLLFMLNCIVVSWCCRAERNPTLQHTRTVGPRLQAKSLCYRGWWKTLSAAAPLFPGLTVTLTDCDSFYTLSRQKFTHFARRPQ